MNPPLRPDTGPAIITLAPGPAPTAPWRFLGWLLIMLGAGGAAPPALPQAVLELPLAGRPVTMDVYRPQGPPRGAAVLSHGYTRSRTTLGGHAASLAAAGVLAVTPDLPYTFDFRRNALALAELVAAIRATDALGAPVARVMLIGFSAGALSSLLAAATPGVVGYVGLDPFDRVLDGEPEALGLAFARTLRTEAILLRGPPSRCNAQSAAAPWAGVLPALVYDRVIEGASHCDFESPTDWICRLACGGTDAARQAAVRAALLAAVERWLPR